MLEYICFLTNSLMIFFSSVDILASLNNYIFESFLKTKRILIRHVGIYVMFSRAAKIAMAITLTVASSPAIAQTFNGSNATCITCANVNNLSAGDLYVLTNASYLAPPGATAFDIGVEVVSRTLPTPTNIGEFNTTGTGGFVQLRFSLLQAGVTDASDFTNFLDTSEVAFTFNIEDIDSNAGDNFTEFAGIARSPGDAGTPLTFGSIGSTLESNDFDNVNSQIQTALTPGNGTAPAQRVVDENGDLSDADYAAYVASLQNYHFANVIPDAGTTDTWTSAENTGDAGVANELVSQASFFFAPGATQFDFLWGTNADFDGTNTRGWEISFTSQFFPGGERPVPEIDGPVMVQVGFALMGLYVLMLGRRRREDEMEMSQAAA